MDIVKVFGANLRRYRQQKGLSQERLAEMCGLHRTYISDLERFQRNVSLTNIALFKISADLTPEYQILYSRNDIHHYHIGKR